MLISLVLEFVHEDSSSLLAGQGKALESIFLSWVAQYDRAYTDEIHPLQVKPFTISDFRVRRSANPEQPGTVYWWRITSLTPRLSSLLENKILPNLPPAITLQDAGCTLRIAAHYRSPQGHPWAGVSSYEAIIQSELLSPAAPETHLNVRFSSPTSFRQDGKLLLFPLPANVFESWLRRWNAFAPVRLPDEEVRLMAEQWVAVSRYRLNSNHLPGEGGPELGFTGSCCFRILTPDPYWQRVFHTLAAYAFFCGTGRKTTRGMGLTWISRRENS